MTLNYRTTKIPEIYFNKIEDILASTNEFVSVSEFIREAIKEKFLKLNSSKREFLLIKDIVFNEETLFSIFEMLKLEDKDLLKPNLLKKTYERSLDLDMNKFLSKFLKNFAYIHPFKDGNKRISWIAVDVFLRLNNKRLVLKAEKNRETKDEIFIWQNSNNQRLVKQIYDFLKKHISDYSENSEDVEKEIEKSIKDNALLIEKLAR